MAGRWLGAVTVAGVRPGQRGVGGGGGCFGDSTTREAGLPAELARREQDHNHNGHHHPGHHAEGADHRRIRHGARSDDQRQEPGGGVERAVSDDCGPDGARSQAQPAQQYAKHHTSHGHQGDPEQRSVAEVVAEKDERRVPQAPDRPAEQQRRPRAERHQAGEQPAAPSHFLAHGSERVDERADRDRQQLGGDEYTDGDGNVGGRRGREERGEAGKLHEVEVNEPHGAGQKGGDDHEECGTEEPEHRQPHNSFRRAERPETEVFADALRARFLHNKHHDQCGDERGVHHHGCDEHKKGIGEPVATQPEGQRNEPRQSEREPHKHNNRDPRHPFGKQPVGRGVARQGARWRRGSHGAPSVD